MRVLESGTLLQDRFLIEDRIGVGGMGAVYSATDQKFGSRVAIKQTFYDNVELAQAFEREARLLNTLHHPVLPHVSDFFSEGGEMLLVMEYIEGEDLSEILKRGDKLAIADVVSWTRELLDALDYLHSQDPPIIHRDIKPNNLKRTTRGNIVLLDFGLAKETSGNTLGMRSVFGYSRRYSPLEQIEGSGTDVRSDVFSLGATIFHLLTGEPPTDVLARASAIVAGMPDPLKLASDINPEVPAGFAAVIRSALALNAADRFVSIAAMREATEYAFGTHPLAAEADPEAGITDEPLPVEGSAEAAPTAGSEPKEVFAIQDHASAGLVTNAAGILFNDHRFWLKGALAAVLLLGLTVLAFTLFNSKPSGQAESMADDPEPSAEMTNVSDESKDEPQLVEEQVRATPPVPLKSSTEKTVTDKSRAEIEKRRNGQTVEKPGRGETAAIREAVPPAPNTAIQPRNRQVTRQRSDQPPVISIETIFTGRSASENWRIGEISDEERRHRRRMRRMKSNGRMPLF